MFLKIEVFKIRMEEYFKAKTKFENIFENMILKAKTF